MAITDLVIAENVPLAPMTTFGIGGPARFLVTIESVGELVDALHHAKSSGLAVFILGGGSNVLIADRGFDGLVVEIAMRGIQVDRDGTDSVVITAAAGEDWDAFVQFCVDRNLAGVECLSGIPGLVGGTPIQNVGAYGQEVSQTIVSVRVLDRGDNSIRTLSNSECGFAYRSSIFSTTEKGRYIVLAVTFSLARNAEPFIGYRDLKEHFAGRTPTLGEVREAVLAIRRAKSMVIDPHDQNSRSAGSFFKNPVVAMDIYDGIKMRFAEVPSFAVDERHVKVPAAWLIERAGFAKGYSRGRAGISANHTLALINRGGASAAHVLALMDEVRQRVFEQFQISLQPEPNFIGFNDA